jgi:hypothetical protein
MIFTSTLLLFDPSVLA